jgi:hypothetical protein
LFGFTVILESSATEDTFPKSNCPKIYNFLASKIPNVISLRCNFYDVKNFDDDTFCKFVADHRDNSAELKSFNIRVRSFGGKMSLKTVGFLVQNTNLEFFEHLFNVRFIDDQFVNFAGIVKSKNLAIIPDFPTQSVENW